MNGANRHITTRTKYDDPKLTFRVTHKLKGELQRRAIRSGRTLNAEIIIRLVRSLAICDLILEVPTVDMR